MQGGGRGTADYQCRVGGGGLLTADYQCRVGGGGLGGGGLLITSAGWGEGDC